jgi:HEAT repeat protein
MKKPPVDIQPLLQDLQSPDWKLRSNAAQALGTSRNRDAVEPLIKVLSGDKSWTARSRAAVALGRLKDERAVEPLIGAMGAGNWQLFNHAFNAVQKFGEKAVPALNRCVNDRNISAHLRGVLVNALGQIGSPSSLFSLMQQLNDGDIGVRLQAIYALGQLNEEAAREKLLEILRDPNVLPPLDFSATPPEMRQFLDPQPFIRKAAIEALAPSQDPRLIEPLVRLFVGDDPYGQQQDMFSAATTVLRQMGNVRSRDYHDLITALQSPNAVTRIAASLSLLWLCDRRGIEPLREATQDADPLVRHAAQWSLNALQTVLSYNVPMFPMLINHMLR